MATELSQEEVLDFLCQGGGKVSNAALVGHFKRFLRDPQAPDEQLLKHRERFKRYVNSVAVVRQEGEVKYVVLRSRYRDLLGEELCPGEPQDTRQVGGGGGDSGHATRHDHQADPGYSEASLITLYCAGTVNGSYDEKSCHDSLYPEPHVQEHLMRSQQPSSPCISPKVAHQDSTWSCPTTSSAPHKHDSNKPSSNTFSQEHPNIFMSPNRTASSGSNANKIPAKTFETIFIHSVQNLSPNTSSMPPNKTADLHGDASMSTTNTSGSLIMASIGSSSNISPMNNSLLPCNAAIPTSNISSLPSKASIISGSQMNASFHVTKTSSSPSNASIPSSNTSSPSNASVIASMSPGLQNNALIPKSKTSSSPSNTSVHSSNTSSPSNASIISRKSPGLQNNTSIPLLKTSSSPHASMPFNKASEPPSNTSPFTNIYSLVNSHLYCMESSCCPSKSPPLPESSISGVGQPWRIPPKEEGVTEYCNPAFVSATSRDLERQKHGCTTCTEPQTPNFHLNGHFHHGVYLEQEDNCNCVQLQQRQFNNCTHPSPFQLLPHESGFSSPDVLLPEDPPTSPSPPIPINDMHGMWMYEMPVFKSIRCQLSLQDMEDFVDQESCGSEGSDSGEGGDCDTEHRDDEDSSSDSNTEKYIEFIEHKCENTRRCPPNRKFLSITEQYGKLQSGDLLGAKDTLVERVGSEPNIDLETRKSAYIAKSFITDQAPVMLQLARQPPKHRMSSRFRELMSSSDDELIDRDYKKRRRPSRTKRPSNILLSPQPDVDMLLSVKPVSCNQLIVNNLANQKACQAQYAPNVNRNPLLNKSFYSKQSSVPLDSLEHDWIVKSASGSWLQVHGLFIEDPQLALRKDFISGYTALHWFAKHGAVEMFHKFVDGAKKAGIELDYNIKSNGGYTPLHIAAIHGHHGVAAMLVEKLRVNVKLRDNSGRRAWQYLSCNTSGEVWQLLGASKGKTIFASRALHVPHSLNAQTKSSHISRKTSLAAFLKPHHQKWKEKNHPVLREREICSD